MNDLRDDVTLETIKPLVEQNLLADGFLHPVAFVCGKDGAGILDLKEGLEDPEAKDALVPWLCDVILKYKAHKLIMVTEAWAYVSPKDMPLEEIKKIAAEGKHKEYFNKKEVYQITEITSDKVIGYVREFFRKEHNTTVTLGPEQPGGEAELDRFLPIQKVLAQLQ